MTDAPSSKRSLLYGLMLRCPRCGVGKLFKSYLKPREECSHCHESFNAIKADDGSASPTIFVTALVIIPLLIFLERSEAFPDWAVFSICLVVASAIVLAVLPRSKGFFIAAVWATSRARHESNER
jgi:uncharacterized protein (DUF983 family)